MHVPFVVSWPGKLTAGRDYAFPVSSLDVAATALALAGVPRPTVRPLDGVNLLPFLTGANTNAPHDRLFWRTGGGAQLATRDHDWKLVRLPDHSDELYNLAEDIGETKDLASRRAEEVQTLGATMDEWNKSLAPPAFPGLSGRAAKPGKRKQSVEP